MRAEPHHLSLLGSSCRPEVGHGSNHQQVDSGQLPVGSLDTADPISRNCSGTIAFSFAVVDGEQTPRFVFDRYRVAQVLVGHIVSDQQLRFVVPGLAAIPA